MLDNKGCQIVETRGILCNDGGVAECGQIKEDGGLWNSCSLQYDRLLSTASHIRTYVCGGKLLQVEKC